MVLCRALMRTLRFSNAPVSALKCFAIHGTTNITKTHVTRCISTSYKHFAERRYTDKHEWVSVDGNIGTIGISNYAQEALGDVVFAQLPEKGLDLSQTDECGALESVKAASELYSPVSGQVTEKNVAVESTPGLINTSCYDDGWLFRVTLTKPDEVKKLMDEKQYQEFLKSDAQHH